MGGDDQRELALAAQPVQVLPQPLAGLRVEADRRFIEERGCGHRARVRGDLEPALHAGGERSHQPVAPVGKLDEREHVSDAFAARRRRDAIDETVKVEVFVKRETVIEARFLEHNAEMSPPVERMLDQIDAADAGGAAVGPQNRAQNVQQRGLAGAVGAEQREQLVRPHLEAHVVERERTAVTFRYAVDLDRRDRDVRQCLPLSMSAIQSRV